MSQAMRELLEEQGKTFEVLNDALDEVRGQIKKLGGADAITQEKADRINADITERMDLIETAYGRRGGAVNDNETDPYGRKAVTEFESWRAGKAVASEDCELSRSDLKTYSKALRKYIARGDGALFDDERRSLEIGWSKWPELEGKALSVGVDAAGGYWVTPQMSAVIKARQFETSPMRSLASVVETSSDSLEMIVDSNDATLGGWVGETDARAATATPEIGKARISVHEQFANPAITQKLLDDSAFDAESWLGRKIADKLTRTENTAFVSGNGVDQPRGFLDYSGAATTDADSARDWGKLEYVFTGSSGAFDTSTVDETASPADELVDLISRLNPAYRANARWLMSRATEAVVRKLRATTGEYLVTLNTGNITGVPLGSFSLLGFPIVGAEDMPVIAANSFSIAFGDFSEGYTIADRGGVRILRDPFTNKPHIQLYSTKRVGGDVTNFDSLKLLKFGTS